MKLFTKLFSLSVLMAAPFLILSCAHPNSAKDYQAAGGTVYQNIAYTHVDQEDVLLDLYLPPSPKAFSKSKKQNFPVIVWIHGGGWRWGSKDFLPVSGLTEAGFAVVSINYRLDGHAKYPAQIDDSRAALRWIKKYGQKYGLDTERVGVLGASAGGHLAAMLGTTGGNKPAFPKVQAVCALYPPTDLITVVKEKDRDSSFTLVAFLLGGPVSKNTGMAREGSPIRYVSHADPPFFLIHGTLDTLVPLEQSQSFHRRLLQAGVSSRLKIYPELKHGFYPDKELTGEIIEFFRKNLQR